MKDWGFHPRIHLPWKLGEVYDMPTVEEEVEEQPVVLPFSLNLPEPTIQIPNEQLEHINGHLTKNQTRFSHNHQRTSSRTQHGNVLGEFDNV